MGLPIYQIEAYQKAPPKVKHTGITQNPHFGPGNWKISKICKKSQQNLKKILKHANFTDKSPDWSLQLKKY